VSTGPHLPHASGEPAARPKGRGNRLKATAEMQVEGTTNVWALGDCALVPMVNGELAPPTAQHAIRQAAVAAHNIVASIRGGPRRTFTFTGLGKLGALGHRSAGADVFGLKISAVVAWFMWRTIYLFKMPGWGRRVKVASSWALDMILSPDITELRFGGARGMSREHFEPGQDVFHQGDVGDRIYYVLKGQAEVVKHGNGGAVDIIAAPRPRGSIRARAAFHEATSSATRPMPPDPTLL